MEKVHPCEGEYGIMGVSNLIPDDPPPSLKADILISWVLGVICVSARTYHLVLMEVMFAGSGTVKLKFFASSMSENDWANALHSAVVPAVVGQEAPSKLDQDKSNGSVCKLA